MQTLITSKEASLHPVVRTADEFSLVEVLTAQKDPGKQSSKESILRSPKGSFHRSLLRPAVLWELMGCKVQPSFKKTTRCGGTGCQDTKTEQSRLSVPPLAYIRTWRLRKGATWLTSQLQGR